MKQFILGVPSEEQPCRDDKLLSYIRTDVQGYAKRDYMAKSDALRAPLADGGAADSETQGELVLLDPLFVEYELYSVSKVLREIPSKLLPYCGVGFKAVVLQRSFL